MGNTSPRLCMCGREVDKESPSQFICLYCSIKQVEKEEQIEKARRKCKCGNAKKPTEVECYFCENKEVNNERKRNSN